MVIIYHGRFKVRPIDVIFINGKKQLLYKITEINSESESLFGFFASGSHEEVYKKYVKSEVEKNIKWQI